MRRGGEGWGAWSVGWWVGGEEWSGWCVDPEYGSGDYYTINAIWWRVTPENDTSRAHCNWGKEERAEREGWRWSECEIVKMDGGDRTMQVGRLITSFTFAKAT